MKIAILGWGSQGQSAFEYWNNDENDITICDKDTTIEIPNGAGSSLGDDYLQNLDNFDLIIRTPALHPRDIVSANANNSHILDRVTTVTNEFFKVCPTKNIIGVTGTKGKGTTSTLIAKILEATGEKVHLGGNIGIPPLELLKDNIQQDDWVVLELANFQLIDLKTSPHIAVCLMVVPEHMDWHIAPKHAHPQVSEDQSTAPDNAIPNLDVSSDTPQLLSDASGIIDESSSDLDDEQAWELGFEEYISAKQQLFINQTDQDIAMYYAENETSLSIADASLGQLIPYMEPPGAVIKDDVVVIADNVICKTSEIKLLGKHNWQNVCAAVTVVWQITQDVDAIRSVLISFTGLEHRLEFVREFNGVKYYDDSFGTTPETAIVAIEAFEQPKVVILGGSDKGATYEELAKSVTNNNVRAVISIGVTGPAITEVLNNAGFENVFDGGTTMTEIVKTTQAHAEEGDVVLLSTACASFDLFNNYKDRGEQFAKAVAELA